MITKEDFTDFEAMIATELSDMEECYALKIEMVQDSEQKNLDPKLAPRMARFYMDNPQMGKVIFIRHKPTNKIISFVVMNFHYSLNWDEIVSRGTSMIIKQEYRGKGLTNLYWNNTHIMQELKKCYKRWWTYVLKSKPTTLQVYKHWGSQMYSNLKILFMDLIFRKDPETKETFSFEENIEFFESKLDSFGFKQGLGFEVVELSIGHFGEIHKQKDNLVNDINTHFNRFSMKGLQMVIDNPSQAGCFTILHKGKVFGIVTLMKYYHLSRNAYDIWITGIYFDPKSAKQIHSDASIYIIQALQAFLVHYSRHVSPDTRQPVRKVFILFYIKDSYTYYFF